jgi:nitrous oxide reductase
MMKDKQPENLKRRGFLFAAGVGSAGAVAVVAGVAGKGTAKPVTTVSAEDKAGNYEETPHISNYYRTARV